MSLFCLPPVPLFSLLPTFSANFTSPQGVLAPGCLRKQDAFCDFSSLFFLLPRYCAELHDGRAIIFFASNELFIILWTNSSRGFTRRERVEGKGETRIRAPTILLFYLTFKDHGIETRWSQSSGSWPLRSLRWLGFFSGCQTAGGTQ